MDFSDSGCADVGNGSLGAWRDHSDLDGKPGDLASRGYGQGRRHHRMDQQGYSGPYRDRAKRRLRRDDAAEKDGHSGSEKGRHDRLLLPLPSEHEGDADGHAVAATSDRQTRHRYTAIARPLWPISLI